jgi:hypothetical protein
MDQKEKIEIEMALRDSVSTALRQISREMDSINRKLQETGSSGFKKATGEADKFQEKATKVTGTISGMSETLGLLSKRLLGPLGIAAAIYSAAKSLDSFAAGKIAMQGFAVNTGFTTGQVGQLTQGMRRLGLTTEEAHGEIGKIGAKLNNLAAYKEGSELWRALQMGGPEGVALGNRMLSMVRAGNQMGAFMEYLKTFDTQSRESKIAMASYMNTTIDVLEGIAGAMKRNVPEPQLTDEQRKKRKEYHDAWIDMETHFWHQMSEAKEGALEWTVDANKKLNEWEKRYNAWRDLQPPQSWLQTPAPPSLTRGGTASGPLLLEILKYGLLKRKSMAEGGVVDEPTFAMLGEGGEREFVIPESKAWWMPGGDMGRADPFGSDDFFYQMLMGAFTLPGSPGSYLRYANRGLLGGRFGLPSQLRQMAPGSEMGGGNLNSLFDMLGIRSEHVPNTDEPAAFQLERIQKDSNKELIDIRGILQQMEDPLGIKKFAEGTGPVDKAVTALVGEKGPEVVGPPYVKIDKPTIGTLSVGQSVTPAEVVSEDVVTGAASGGGGGGGGSGGGGGATAPSGSGGGGPMAGAPGPEGRFAARDVIGKKGFLSTIRHQTLQPGETISGKGSWFGNWKGQSDWVDKGDIDKQGRPLPAYTGAKPFQPGIALPSQVTSGPADANKGEWFDVTGPNGATVRVRQTDVGPNIRLDRPVDINSALAEQMGYTPKTFPTDAPFKVRRVPEHEMHSEQRFADANAIQQHLKDQEKIDAALTKRASGTSREGTMMVGVDFGDAQPANDPNKAVFKRLRIDGPPHGGSTGGYTADPFNTHAR